MHDTLTGCGCGCGAGTDCCWTLPPEFVRVRYFFGQRLGVMELSDEAAYHGGKRAFHNARLHGVGVVCGLRAERFVLTPGSNTTVLRVRKGAALDACGREIVAAVDQCIDVAAWFAKNRSRPELSGWTAGTSQTLRVALRYRECPTDPSPAPRDPCGCDNGGCEFGRVREAFELALFTDAEVEQCHTASFPAAEALRAAMAGVGPPGPAVEPSERLKRAIDALVAGDCPVPTENTWLCLASFTVTLDATPVPVNISDPDNAIPERRSLLSTSALQAMAVGLSAAGLEGGALGGGPHIGPLSFTATAADAGTLSLPVALAETGSPPVAAPLVEATFDPASVKAHRLDPTLGWQDVTPPPAGIAYEATPAPRIRIDLGPGLTAGPRFRLTIEPPFATPVVDAVGRPLQPLRFARLFAFVTDAGGNLQLDPAV
jgi:hypothetical protein